MAKKGKKRYISGFSERSGRKFKSCHTTILIEWSFFFVFMSVRIIISAKKYVFTKSDFLQINYVNKNTEEILISENICAIISEKFS